LAESEKSNMNIQVQRISSLGLPNELAAFTIHGRDPDKQVKTSNRFWYRSRHSPVRGAIFVIKMYDIPTFVSVHLVRHKVGVEHFVTSNRLDRGATDVADRNTPVSHAMLINADALIAMAHKRLCQKASKETREVMNLIKQRIAMLDVELADCLVPLCVYRGGLCDEKAPCAHASNML
jgi:hypothetical protein